MENVVENVVENFVPVLVEPGEVPAVVDAAPVVEAAAKEDRRKGKRRVDNDDGTRSYGLKADGTPRSKPGRRKAVQVVAEIVEAVEAAPEANAV